MPLTRLPSRPRNSSRPPQPFSRSPNPSPSPATAPTFPSSNPPTRPSHGATKSVSLELGQDWEPNDLEEKLGIHEIWNDIEYWEQALTEKGKLISGKTMSVNPVKLPLHSLHSRTISLPILKFHHPPIALSFALVDTTRRSDTLQVNLEQGAEKMRDEMTCIQQLSNYPPRAMLTLSLSSQCRRSCITLFVASFSSDKISHPFVLLDVCTLHTAPQVVTQPAQHTRGRSSASSNSKGELSVETNNLAPPFSDLSRVDSAQDDGDSAVPRLEIAPGDPLLRPRGIHSPTVSSSAVTHFPDLSPTAQSTPATELPAPLAQKPSTAPTSSVTSSMNAQRRSNLLGVSNPVFSFPSPGSSIAASSHPALPISRVGSPDYYAGVNGNGGSREDTGGNTTPTGLTTPSTSYLSHPGSAANGSAQSQSSPASSFQSTSPSSQSQATSTSTSKRSKWILHPRRGHAALNSGIKSLSGRSGRELVVVGRPDDLEKVTNLSTVADTHSSQSPTKNYPIPESSSPGAVSPGVLAANSIGWGKLGQGELSARERRDLERGLKEMGGPTTGDGGSGIGCVPVWLEDEVHTSTFSPLFKTSNSC